MRKVITAMVAALALALAAPAIASASTSATIGRCYARGSYATCDAGGTAWRPSSLTLYVSTTHSQRISVDWDVVCGKGSGAGSRSGSFTTWVRRVTHRRVPTIYYHPGDCTVAVGAQLQQSWGQLRVWIRRVQY